jgi:hypothetical protein
MPNAMESRAKIERGVMAKLHTRMFAPAKIYIDLGPDSRGHMPQHAAARCARVNSSLSRRGSSSVGDVIAAALLQRGGSFSAADDDFTLT